MATLADINKQLIEQNDTLVGVGKEIGKVSSGLETFLRNMASDRYDQLERDREAAAQQRKEQQAEQSKPEPKMPSGKGLFGDMFENIKGGLGLGTGAGLVAALGGFLLKRGLPALLANVFADEIADFIESETGSAELGDAVHRALKLGSFGLLLGKRFGLLAGVIGGLLTPDNQNKLTIMGDNLKKAGENLEQFFGVSLPNLEQISTFITGSFGEGLDAINAALEGDSEKFIENLDGLAVSIGALALLLKPRGTIALAIAGVTAAVAGVKKAAATLKPGGIPNVNQKLPGVITPDKQGYVTSQSGQKFKATSPQGQMIIQASKDRAVKAMAEAGGMMSGQQAVDVAKKYPRFGKLLGVLNGIPGANLAINAGMLALILMDENTSPDQKIKSGAGLFAGIGGSALGAALGTAVFPGLGTAVGGVGGYFLGDALGQYVMEWLLGNRNDIDSGLKKMIESNRGMTTGEFEDITQDTASTPTPVVRTSAPIMTPTPLSGYNITQMANEFAARTAQPIVIAGGDTNVVQGGTTNTQEIAIGGPTPMFALRDYLDQSRN